MGLKPYEHTNTGALLKLMLYGQPGTGKTFFGASASEVGKTLFLNVEGGMMSAKPSPNIMVFDVRNTPSQSAIAFLDQVLWALADRNLTENPWIDGLKTIVLDSGSEYSAAALEWIVRNEVQNNPKRKGASVDNAWVDDYGRLTSTLKRQFRMLKDLPYNVIVTALAKSKYPKLADGSPSDNPSETKPDFTDKVAESIMGYMDAVWYAYRMPPGENEKEGKPVILTQPHGVVRAKTRGVAFPTKLDKVLVQPTFKGILTLLSSSEGSVKK
jgi:hypothetical protein